MLTIGTVKQGDKDKPIDVDLSDYGYLYLLQGDSVIEIAVSKIGDLVKILETVHD